MSPLLLVGLALAVPYLGGEGRPARGDGSVALNSRVQWESRVAERLVWPMAPVVDGESVFVGTPEGRLLRLGPSGGVEWRVELGSPASSPVTVAEDRVYVLDQAGTLHVRSASDGAELARVPVLAGRSTSAPLAIGEHVYASGLDRSLAAVRVGTWTVEWKVTLPAASAGSFAAGEGLLVGLGTDGVVRGVSRTDGTVRWTHPLTPGGRGTPAVEGGVVYVADGAGTVEALALATGERRWGAKVDGAVDGGVAVGSELVFVGTKAGRVFALARVDGSLRWRQDVAQPVVAPVVVSGAELVVPTSLGVLHRLAVTDGRSVGQTGVGSAADGAPAIRDGHVVLGLADGRVLSVGDDAALVAAPSSGPGEAFAVDSTVWVGRRLFLGAIRRVLTTAAGTTFVLADGAGLVVTRDGGVSWRDVAAFGGEQVLGIEPRERELLVFTDGGSWRSADDGRSWLRLATTRPADPSVRRVVNGGFGRLLAVGARWWLSSDGGSAWAPLDVGRALREVVPDPLAVALLYALGEDGALLRSSDAGRSWAALAAAPAGLRWLRPGGLSPGSLLAITASGALKLSWDGGGAWAPVGLPGGVGAARAWWLPRVSKGLLVLDTNGRLWLTRDAGGAWSALEGGLPAASGWVDAEVSVSADGGVVLAITDTSGQGGVYRLGLVKEHHRLDQVSFEPGSAVLTPTARATLAVLFTAMKRDPDLVLRAEGHTDDVGEDEANLSLSIRRARAIQAAAAAAGVAPGRVDVAGYGESRPAASNATAEGKAVNRRVELYLVDGDDSGC